MHYPIAILVSSVLIASSVIACGTAPSSPSSTSTNAGTGVTVPIGSFVGHHTVDADSGGVIEKVGNTYNTSIVSNDPNVFKAEYEAGFIEGNLQKSQILASRDNSWDSAYLTDPSHAFPTQIPPSANEIAMAQRTLSENWDYTLEYISTTSDATVAKNLRRLMYRLVGIYHGATLDAPAALSFDGTWLPAFTPSEMGLGYETPTLTFGDIYFINAFQDALYLLPANAPPAPSAMINDRPSKCTAFVKVTPDDIILTHNSWNSFLDQSQTISLWVNGDLMTFNAGGPGYLGSNVDFGYTNKGLIFNETTHRYSYTEPKVDALWMFWRATAAEQFAASIDEFFKYVSLDASGTYMNGYMVVDTKTHEIGLVEMSYKSFVFFRSDGTNPVKVTTKPEGLSTAYDPDLVQPDHLLGINFPASLLIRSELQSTDNRPARRVQLMAGIGGVTDIASAKALITYTDPTNPLSIYGRWDLGYGITSYPKTIPDGSDDAKAIAASMISYTFGITGVLDTASTNKAFWMKYGTAQVNGKPFIWSESPWPTQKLRNVPDRVEGYWIFENLHIR